MKTLSYWAAGLGLLAAAALCWSVSATAADPAGTLLPKEATDAVIQGNADAIAEALKAAKPTKPMIRKAKAAAISIAAAATDQLGDKAAAPVAAATRDAALQIIDLVAEDKFADAAKLAGEIKAGMKPAAAVKAVPLGSKTDLETIMQPFKAAKSGGMDLEATIRDIKDGKVKLTKATSPALEKAINHTILLAKLSEEVKADGAKKDWDGWAKDMKESGLEAIKAAKAGKEADFKKAVSAIDTSCTNCHNAYRK